MSSSSVLVLQQCPEVPAQLQPPSDLGVFLVRCRAYRNSHKGLAATVAMFINHYVTGWCLQKSELRTSVLLCWELHQHDQKLLPSTQRGRHCPVPPADHHMPLAQRGAGTSSWSCGMGKERLVGRGQPPPAPLGSLGPLSPLTGEMSSR